MKVVVFTLPDGRIALTPVSQVVLDKYLNAGVSQEDAEAAIRAIAVLRSVERHGPVSNVRTVDDTDIPEVDYTNGKHGEFREALVNTPSGPLTVDMGKAREIHKTRLERAKLRKARELLDREAMGEDVRSDKAQLVAVDVNALVNTATTPDELRAVRAPILEEMM